MKVTKARSGSLYEEKEIYSRVVAVDNWVFVPNTAGRNYKTREMSTDPVEQAKQCMKNIEGALAAVSTSLADVVRSRVVIPGLSHQSFYRAECPAWRDKLLDPA